MTNLSIQLSYSKLQLKKKQTNMKNMNYSNSIISIGNYAVQ